MLELWFHSPCKDEQDVSGTSDDDDDYCDFSSKRFNKGDAVQGAKEDEERCWDVCIGPGQQDDLLILSTGLFTRLCPRWLLHWFQHEALAHLWPLQLHAQDLLARLQLLVLRGWYTIWWYHDKCYHLSNLIGYGMYMARVYRKSSKFLAIECNCFTCSKHAIWPSYAWLNDIILCTLEFGNGTDLPFFLYTSLSFTIRSVLVCVTLQ